MTRLRVLIVEDEAIIALSMEALLGSLGHEVCATAATAGEALEAAARERPDLAIMDIQLGDKTSGVDAAAALFHRWGIRCLFISGNLDTDTRAALAPYSPLGFLNKPFLPSRFTDTIRSLTL